MQGQIVSAVPDVAKIELHKTCRATITRYSYDWGKYGAQIVSSFTLTLTCGKVQTNDDLVCFYGR
jgi:hypothetical protein